MASSRARAYYLYDAGGRLTQLNTWWDTWNSGTSSYNTPEAVINNTCDYEVSTGTSNANRGLKTHSYFGVQDSSDSSTFMLAHQEQYAYDDNLDYLTQAKYDDNADSTWDQTDNWTYDAAGNRNDATVVDNLNRATTIGGVSRTYDVLGNTLTIGSSKTMTWDIMNRMLSLNNGTNTTDYAYRGDGMRVVKETGTKLTSYGYDGQMPVEESLVDSANSNNDSVIRYALGARGIDRISRTTSSGTATGYPLYDAHGNNVATLTKSGSFYSLGDQRSYDAWGGIRAGNTSGEPNGRYCANLGHLSDDESGFVYMRARYYEPESGRFLSEDPAMDGLNYLQYCSNDPINRSDNDGKMSKWLRYGIDAAVFIAAVGAMIYFSRGCHPAAHVAVNGLIFLGLWFGDKILGRNDDTSLQKMGLGMYLTTHEVCEQAVVLSIMAANDPAFEKQHLESQLISTVANYFLVLGLFMFFEFGAGV